MLDFKSNLTEYYNSDFKQHNLGNKEHIFVLFFPGSAYTECHILRPQNGSSWFVLDFLIAYFHSNNSAIAVDLI